MTIIKKNKHFITALILISGLIVATGLMDIALSGGGDSSGDGPSSSTGIPGIPGAMMCSITGMPSNSNSTSNGNGIGDGGNGGGWDFPTHNVCSGNLCVSVAGAGVDECSSNAQCVPSPDFSLNSSNNIYITILKEKTGESNTTNISITPLNGFNSPVTLSVQNQSPSLPSGSVVSFSPGGGTSQTLNSPYAGGSDFKVSIGPGLTSSQQYTLTVQGVDGGLINTTDVILNVLVKNPGWQEI